MKSVFLAVLVLVLGLALAAPSLAMEPKGKMSGPQYKSFKSQFKASKPRTKVSHCCTGIEPQPCGKDTKYVGRTELFFMFPIYSWGTDEVGANGYSTYSHEEKSRPGETDICCMHTKFNHCYKD